MPIQLQSTSGLMSVGNYVLCYGTSGAGKTALIATAPNPVVFDAEKGLKTLRRFNIPFVEITSTNSLLEAYRWLSSAEARQFQTVALDSLSEICELCLVEEMKKTTNGQKAYGEMAKKMIEIIRAFKSLKDKNVYFTCKEERIKDNGNLLFAPFVPGDKFGQAVPYQFDEIWRLVVQKDPVSGADIRYVRTQADFQSVAKSRSQLDPLENANLSAIFAKAAGA